MNETTQTIRSIIKQRFSTRAFQDTPVSKKTIELILECARWAPSGANLQPWQVAVLSGQAKQALSKAIVTAYDSGESPTPEHPYYPEQWYEPYKSRRFATGMALYEALNIQRDDKQRRQAQWKANYDFFGAPVGLIFHTDKRLGHACWVDMGIFLQTVMLAAQAEGLATCPQAAFGDYPHIIRRQLQLSDNNIIICGMALGYADAAHPVNQYRTERCPVSEFTSWYE